MTPVPLPPPSNSVEYIVAIICATLLIGFGMWLKLGGDKKKNAEPTTKPASTNSTHVTTDSARLREIISDHNARIINCENSVKSLWSTTDTIRTTQSNSTEKIVEKIGEIKGLVQSHIEHHTP